MRTDVMRNFVDKENVGLVLPRLSKDDWGVLCAKSIVAHKLVSAYDSNSLLPLYLYTEQGEKIPNLDKEIWKKINETVGETTPENILDYVYAFLHSPSYREKYKEFLKIDFPRAPYPKNKEEFWRLVPLGTKLRELHLMTSPECNKTVTTYSQPGDNLVEKIKYEKGKVYINSTQYFGDVPGVAWNFYIGGYQPAQKWLKDRKGKTLSNEDIEHYQRIIAVQMETNKIMKEIEE